MGLVQCWVYAQGEPRLLLPLLAILTVAAGRPPAAPVSAPPTTTLSSSPPSAIAEPVAAVHNIGAFGY